jgi:hypothetical protein
MKRQTDIISAIRNPKIFGSLFIGNGSVTDLSSWVAWMVWLKAAFALPMDATELALYRQCTGREHPPKVPPGEIYTIVGRRGGKSFISSLVAAYLGCFNSYRKYLNAGERAVILVLARDREQARVCFSYISGIIHQVAPLAAMVVSEKADEIELDNRVTIMVKTSDFRSVRGLTLAAVAADEVCFWDSQGVSPDTEIFAALRPAMATIPGSKLIAISIPYSKHGQMYEAHREYFGVENPDVLVWQAETRTMNPTISKELIQRELERDPDSASAEWLAKFRDDLESAFSVEAVRACIVPGRDELPPSGSISYKCFVDPSGGRHDSFTLAISHRGKDVAVLDLVREWKAPFDPSVVVKEASDIARRYRCSNITGDNYSGEWCVEAFKQHRITYQRSDKNKSELYLGLIPAINAKQVELLDHPRLLEQLRRLERRRGRTGKDSIDHPPRLSDDVANSVAGALALVAKKTSHHPGAPIAVGRGIFAGRSDTAMQQPFIDSTLRPGGNGEVEYEGAEPTQTKDRWNW